MTTAPPRLLGGRVVADACVLFPVVVCDVLLTAQEVGILQSVVATPAIIDEAHRNACDRYPDKADGITRRMEAIAGFVEGGRGVLPPREVDREELINAKDRHVLRAAVHYEADFIVTADMDFHTEVNRWTSEPHDPPSHLWGALTPDAFLNAVRLADPAKLRFLIRTMAANRAHPPSTPEELAVHLQQRFPSLETFEISPTG